MNYSVPGPWGDQYFVLRLFTGYGETLSDYNRAVNRIGVGIIMAR